MDKNFGEYLKKILKTHFPRIKPHQYCSFTKINKNSAIYYHDTICDVQDPLIQIQLKLAYNICAKHYHLEEHIVFREVSRAQYIVA